MNTNQEERAIPIASYSIVAVKMLYIIYVNLQDLEIPNWMKSSIKWLNTLSWVIPGSCTVNNWDETPLHSYSKYRIKIGPFLLIISQVKKYCQGSWIVMEIILCSICKWFRTWFVRIWNVYLLYLDMKRKTPPFAAVETMLLVVGYLLNSME